LSRSAQTTRLSSIRWTTTLIRLRISDAALAATEEADISGIRGIWRFVEVVTSVCQLEVSKTSAVDVMSWVATLNVTVTTARGKTIEAAAVSIWGRVTGGGSVRGGPCRIGALRQGGHGQRDGRRRNGGNQREFGLVDHCAAINGATPGGFDQEMRAIPAFLN
jgi:hypothetical protein